MHIVAEVNVQSQSAYLLSLELHELVFATGFCRLY